MLLAPLIGLAIAGLAIAYAAATGKSSSDVLFSGQSALGPFIEQSGSFTVGADKSVSGSVTTTGVAGVAAHIHTGAAGKNGPVAVGLTKTSDATWSAPAGAKFTDAQYEAYKAGDTYVNVHSAANKGGEIRGQLRP